MDSTAYQTNKAAGASDIVAAALDREGIKPSGMGVFGEDYLFLVRGRPHVSAGFSEQNFMALIPHSDEILINQEDSNSSSFGCGCVAQIDMVNFHQTKHQKGIAGLLLKK